MCIRDSSQPDWYTILHTGVQRVHTAYCSTNECRGWADNGCIQDNVACRAGSSKRFFTLSPPWTNRMDSNADCHGMNDANRRSDASGCKYWIEMKQTNEIWWTKWALQSCTEPYLNLRTPLSECAFRTVCKTLRRAPLCLQSRRKYHNRDDRFWRGPQRLCCAAGQDLLLPPDNSWSRPYTAKQQSDTHCITIGKK